MAQPIIIAVTGEKGGTAKSTTAANLADQLAAKNIRTLLVDLDPRGDCAILLGQKPEPGLRDLFITEMSAPACIRHTKFPHLDVLPSNATTEGVLAYLTTMQSGIREIQEKFRSLGNNFGYQTYQIIIFDAAPAAGILRKAAVQMADIVILPTKPEALGLAEVRNIIDILGNDQIAIVLPTMCRPISVHQAMIDQMQQWWPTNTLARKNGELVTVPLNKVPPEASAIRLPLRAYAPDDKTTQAYTDLTTIVLDLIKAAKETR